MLSFSTAGLVAEPLAGDATANRGDAIITVGVRAHLGQRQAISRWQPTIDYLSDRIDGASFRLVPYDSPAAVIRAAEQGQFDYVITDPGSFVMIDALYGVEERLSLVNEWDDHAITQFGSVLFVRKNAPGITTLEDLRGHSLMAVSPNAFGGWLVMREQFVDAGHEPSRFLGGLRFAEGNQQDVVFAVRDGQVDAGVVRTGTLERMDRSGKIDLDNFRIIDPRAVPGFPFALSSELYPEWVFAESPGAPDRFREQVLGALYDITPASAPARAGGYVGWQNAGDYWKVHKLFQSLKVMPYEHFGETSINEFLLKHRFWLLTSAAGLVGLIALLMLAVRNRSGMARLNAEIARMTGAELNLYRDAIDQHSIISTSDAEGKFTYVNDRFVEISGYSREEIIGKPHSILRSNEHSPEFYDQIWETLGRGEIWTGELANRRKDGSLWWIQTTIAPRVDENGRTIGFVSIRTDVTDLKATQAEMNLRDYLECTPGEVLRFRKPDSGFSYANAAARNMAGMSQEDLKRKTLFDFVSDEDADWIRDQLNTLSQQRNGAITFECERIMPDGRRVDTSFWIQHLCPRGGAPRFIAMLHDISDHSATRKRLAQLTATLEDLDDQIYMFWPETKRFFYANKAARSRLGVSEADIERLTPADLDGGLTDEECQSVLRPMIKGEQTQHVFQRQIHHEDGSVQVLEYDVKYVCPEGHDPCFVAVLRDVTARAQAECEVRQLKTSLDLADDEFYMFWPDSYAFTYMNRRSLERVGWERIGWQGKHTWDFITDQQQEWLEEKCEALIEGPEKSTVFETTDRNGTPIEIYLHLVEPEGEPPRFLSIYRDITERKQAETAKGQFISTVSHELRTPLTSIKGSLGLLKAGIGSLEPQRAAKMIDIARMNADRLHALVDDILDWEKIEAGKMTYHFEEANLSELVREAAELNQGYAKQHGIIFDVAVPHRPVMCLADRGRTLQVMSNLLSNAAKFSGDGTTVEITLRLERTQAVVSVRDHGIGIPENARASLFQRFTQADSSDVRRQGGTGLGLSISRAIVEAHGGTIGFEDAEGGGTRFEFRIPLLHSEDDPDPRLADHETEDAGPRVLVCEDQAEIAMDLWLALERSGMETSVVVSAAHALEQMATRDFDGVAFNISLDTGPGGWIDTEAQSLAKAGKTVALYSTEATGAENTIENIAQAVAARVNCAPAGKGRTRGRTAGRNVISGMTLGHTGKSDPRAGARFRDLAREVGVAVLPTPDPDPKTDATAHPGHIRGKPGRQRKTATPGPRGSTAKMDLQTTHTVQVSAIRED